MKKYQIIVALTALVLMLAMLPIASFAGQAPTKDGETSTITMVPKMNDGKLELSFDLQTPNEPLSGVIDLYYSADYLQNPTPVSDTSAGQPSTVVYNDKTPGNILMGFANAEPLKSGELFKVVFDVKEACVPGTELEFSVKIENSELVDNDTTTLLTFTIETVKFTVPAAYEKGDVNANGKLDAADATQVLRFAVGIAVPTEDQLNRADMNNNGKADAGDATTILRKVVGL